MRSSLLTLFAALLLASVLGGSVAAEPLGASPAVYELGVNGLFCPFCAYGIEKKLKGMEGVERVDIRIEDGVVRVTMAPRAVLGEERAREIVKDAGFALRSFRRLGVDDAPEKE